MEFMEFFQPRGRSRKKVADTGDVIGEYRACGSGEELRQSIMAIKRRVKESEKKAEG
jgi:hypothetical protein